jgi:hypothetical protein
MSDHMTDRTKPKSQPTQFLLALLFGPIGLLYSSFPAGVLLLLAAAVLAKDFGRAGAFFVWPVAVITGFLTVRQWNRSAAKCRGAENPYEPGTSPTPTRGLDHG